MDNRTDKTPIPWGYFLFSIMFGALGVLFIVFTLQAKEVINYFIAGATILAAVVNVVITLARKNRGVRFYVQITLSVFAIISGVIMFIDRDSIEYIVGTTAFLLIIDGAFKLQSTVQLSEKKFLLCWAVLALIVVTFFGNVYLIKFYDGENVEWMLRLLGIMLIFDGVLNLFTPIMLTIGRKKAEEVEKKAEIKGATPVAELPIKEDKE